MIAEDFWSHVDQSAGPTGCWPWTAGRTRGRGKVEFEGRTQYAYRVAWQLAHGEAIPGHLLACHRCDNPICCNPAHLFVGTHADNAADAKSKGRLRNGVRPTGMAHVSATVPPEVIVQAITEYLNGTESQEAVARRYGVSATSISDWLRGRSRPDSGLAPTRKRLKPCGTHAAYTRHVRRGERPCDLCVAAERQWDRDRYAAKRAAAS